MKRGDVIQTECAMHRPFCDCPPYAGICDVVAIDGDERVQLYHRAGNRTEWWGLHGGVLALRHARLKIKEGGA